MDLAKKILEWSGWVVDITVPDYPKCIICVAPHTSNWDFILGKLAYASIGRKAGFLMKETWFFWPLGYLFRSIGGIAVPRGRKRKGSLVDFLINKYNTSDRLTLAITPEGTRSRTEHWHTGFLRIAYATNVPIVLGILDFGHKEIIIRDKLDITGDIAKDLRYVKDYYRGYEGKNPDNFATD